MIDGAKFIIAHFLSASSVVRVDSEQPFPATVTSLGTIYLDFGITVDVGAETVRLTKELEKIAQHIAGTEARLNNPTFVGKAPPAVIDGAKKQLADLKAKQAELQRLLAALA